MTKKEVPTMAKRRANGEGSIRHRSDGRWEGRYTVGHDPETGKGVFNKDFLSWNMLVANMIAWKEKREVISEL